MILRAPPTVTIIRAHPHHSRYQPHQYHPEQYFRAHRVNLVDINPILGILAPHGRMGRISTPSFSHLQ